MECDYVFVNDTISEDKIYLNTLTDMTIFQNEEKQPIFNWEIVENSIDVIVSGNYNSNTIKIATLSAAISPTISLNLTYTE